MAGRWVWVQTWVEDGQPLPYPTHLPPALPGELSQQQQQQQQPSQADMMQLLAMMQGMGQQQQKVDWGAVGRAFMDAVRGSKGGGGGNNGGNVPPTGGTPP